MKYGFPCKDWDTMHKLLKQGEYAFDKFMDTDIIQHISCAQSQVKFNTMTPSPCSLHKKGGRYYNGLGFGINVYLRSHIDQDFTMSIVQAHIDNYDYKKWKIESFATLHSRKLDWLWHFNLVTFCCSIHRNHTLFPPNVKHKTKYM